MSRNYDWSHPLPFGDSVWVKKDDVEPLARAVRKMLDEIYEFGSVVSNEYVELAESAYIKLVGDEPANTGLHTDGAKAGEILKYWQHDDTGRLCASASRPSNRWFEITKEMYESDPRNAPNRPAGKA